MTRVHVVHIQLHISCTHNRMAEKLYNTKFMVANMTENSCKRQPIACQLHSDWLQMTRFLVVKIN
jgi:hypothetical protein